MEFQFQFGVVGVGYGGGKAHFVIVRVGEPVYRYGREVREYYNADVYCGSQKWSGWSRSAINGFAPVGEVYVGNGAIPEWAVEHGEEYAQRIAVIAARSNVYSDYWQQAFEAVVEKYGDNFCAKCKKSGEKSIAWKVQKEAEAKEGK